MRFRALRREEFSYERSHQELVSGPYTLAEIPFLLGQHRIQVWRGMEVVGMNF